MNAAATLVRLRRPRSRDTVPLPRLHVRLLARMRAAAIDRELAGGALPWCSQLHAARGVQLTSIRSQKALAGSLERLLAHAESPAAPLRAAVPPCIEQVRAARSQILSIGARLRSGAPADCRGIAKLRVLLSDGAGPCYLPIHPAALTLALDDVSQWLDAMD
jgi:hypothetical protein